VAYCRVVLLSTAICFSHTQLMFNYLSILMLFVIQIGDIIVCAEARDIFRSDGAETCSQHETK
jgi:hypothetical protein